MRPRNRTLIVLPPRGVNQLPEVALNIIAGRLRLSSGANRTVSVVLDLEFDDRNRKKKQGVLSGRVSNEILISVETQSEDVLWWLTAAAADVTR